MSFPIKNGGSFHSYANVYQRVTRKTCACPQYIEICGERNTTRHGYVSDSNCFFLNATATRGYHQWDEICTWDVHAPFWHFAKVIRRTTACLKHGGIDAACVGKIGWRVLKSCTTILDGWSLSWDKLPSVFNWCKLSLAHTQYVYMMIYVYRNRTAWGLNFHTVSIHQI